MREYQKICKERKIQSPCCDGICQNYTILTCHGEVDKKIMTVKRHEVDVDMDDRLEDMIVILENILLGKLIFVILYVVKMTLRYIMDAQVLNDCLSY